MVRGHPTLDHRLHTSTANNKTPETKGIKEIRQNIYAARPPAETECRLKFSGFFPVFRENFREFSFLTFWREFRGSILSSRLTPPSLFEFIIKTKEGA